MNIGKLSLVSYVANRRIYTNDYHANKDVATRCEIELRGNIILLRPRSGVRGQLCTARASCIYGPCTK